MKLKVGTLLQGDKYRIISMLGQGGFAITYLAEQVMAGRKVCIKEFFPKDFYNRNDDTMGVSLGSLGSADMMDAYKHKFVKEAKIIARLDHPNITHIFDVFEENNTVYYVMDYIDGGTLLDRVKQHGPMSEHDALKYIRKVANALSYIHSINIAHLDIKPSNIMVRSDDDRPVLIDFGLSKKYDADGVQTSSTPVGLSHGFAPIEQYEPGGVNAFSPQTDIYSLGATLYYLLTGVVPPRASVIICEGLSPINGVSPRVFKAIEKAMEVRMHDRPKSIEEFVAMLEGDVAPAAIADEDTKIDLGQEIVVEEPIEEPVVELDVETRIDDMATLPIIEAQPVEIPEVKLSEQPVPVAEQPRTKRSLWLWLMIVFVAVAVLGGALIVYFSDTTEEEYIDPTIPNVISDEEFERMRAESVALVEEVVTEEAVAVEEVVAEETVAVEEVVAEESVAEVVVAAPVFRLTSSASVSVSSELTHGSIRYTLENPVDGQSVQVSGKPDWIYISYADNAVNYSVYANSSVNSRSATLTVSYGDQSFNVTFSQEGGDNSPNVIYDDRVRDYSPNSW